MKAILFGGVALSLLTVSALGADLALPPSVPLPPAPPPFTWTGCYGGLHAGGGFGQKDLTDTTGVLFPTTGLSAANLNISGYMLGGQLGCDYQFASNWVLGVEGAASGGSITGKTNLATPGILGDTATFKVTTDFLMSATARVGYAWDRWLLYAKGGIAGAGDKYSLFDAAQTYDFEALENRVGWTGGAGIEWAPWNEWSIRLEYDYYGFGTRSVFFNDSAIAITSGSENIKQNIQVVLLGVNFHPYPGP